MQQNSLPAAALCQRLLEGRLSETGRQSHKLAAPLTPEDVTVQPTDDASPSKWCLAHVTWFFETFILFEHLAGYRPMAEALGEHNGKVMVGQQVLRGSSCATPPGHTRASYRNFFYPHQRWQFTGLRLASERA